MSTLVVYHPDNLLNPTKVLSHAHDIGAELDRSGIAFALIPDAASVIEEADDGSLAGLLEEQVADHVPSRTLNHVQLLRFESLPGYAVQNPETAEQEHWHREEGARLFVEGGGTLCIRHTNALHVLSCARGTLVLLPAGTLHWFRQRAGAPCVVARMAPSAAGLEQVASGDDIAARMELPEL